MKNQKAKVTHTEILCLAINQLESQIEVYRQKSLKFPDDHPTAMMLFDMITPLKEKQDIIKQLYEIETGVAYN